MSTVTAKPLLLAYSMPAASFICRRLMVWDGVDHEPGDAIPDGLAADRSRLRRFWEEGWIDCIPTDPREPRAVSYGRGVTPWAE